MRGPTWIRVVLWLAFLVTPGVAALEFSPLAERIALPDSVAGKAIWALARLPDGRLAAGFEGGVALGIPGGAWAIVATPNGSPIQAVAAAHDRILAAGGGCIGFVETGLFVSVPTVDGQITTLLPVTEGWLLAGPTGLWLVAPDGAARRLSGAPGAQIVDGGDQLGPLILVPGQPAQGWRDGALTALEPGRVPAEAWLLRDRLWFTRGGIREGETVEPVLAPAVTTTLVDEAGLVGAATGRPWLLFATYWQGLQAFRRGAERPDWTWRGPGACYAFARDGGSLLAGTAEGAFGLADPNRVRVAHFPTTEVLHLETDTGGARLVTLRSMIDLGDVAPADPDLLWPVVGGATVTGNTLRFRERTIALPTRYLNGLDVRGDTAALAYGNTLLLARGEAPILRMLNSGITSLASDEKRFLVGTQADGVLGFSLAGEPLGAIGSGRCRVRTLRPGRTVFLFWNGEVHSAHDGLLARVPVGNPRDAALVVARGPDGRDEAEQLAVLATRPDAAPVLGLLDRERWIPLEVPGLAEIGAEAVAASGEVLYVAGRHGVLEVRFPLVHSPRPIPSWRWSDGSPDARVTLADEQTDRAVLIPGAWEVPPHPPISYKVRVRDEEWIAATPGVPVALPARWGRNELTLRLERNGLGAERALFVVRPYPWWLRPWALALEAAALAGAVWGLGRWRVRHLLRQKRQLEAAVEQRTVQLRKANAAKEEFLASVSHEIRNPLNGVVGICAILQDSRLGPREQNFVRVLSGCAEQLHSMLDDVLDFSRIERGEITLTLAPFEICALVEEAVRVMDPSLESCTLQLPEAPRWLEGDAGKIRQVVCNLVSNALKYGRPREAGIQLRITPEAGTKFRVRLTVHNAGPTIPADELPRLFESFRRGTGTDNTPGFGLGLAVCRRLADRMGGCMTAASADGSTEFALELSLAAAVAPTARGGAPATVSRALAIEDEDYNRLALGHTLRALGYEIDWAVDGASALQLARRQAYDLILTDWRLPDINGDELCRQLVSILTPPRPPIIAVTAYSSAEKMAAARAAGMAGFVTKPITREKLEQLIRNLDTGPQPRPAADVSRAAAPHPALALLGELAPTLEKLSADIATGWQQTEAQARLRDPRASRAAHALRSLLLLATETDLAEQLGLLEQATAEGEWDTAERLLDFIGPEIQAARARLSAPR